MHSRATRLILTIILTVQGLTAGAQHSLYNLRFKLSRTDFADTIAIESDNGRIVLPVSFNGYIYHFLFDTGASQTTLFDDTPIEGTHGIGYTVSRDALLHTDTVSKVALPPMTIGSVVFTGCEGVVQKRIGRRSKDIDGIVGFDIICKGLSAKIDLQAGHIILTDMRDFFRDEPGADIPYRLDYHVPYITVTPFAKTKDRALLDTGSPFLYLMNKQRFDASEQEAGKALLHQIAERKTGRHSMSHSGPETVGEVVTLRLDSLKTGQLTLYDVPARTTQGGSHIGSRLLQYGTLVILPHRRKLRFHPYIPLN